MDLADIAEVWRRGSVISSWLLDLGAMALADDSNLANFIGAVEGSGEGRWTVDAAVEEAVPANVLAASLFARFSPPIRAPRGGLAIHHKVGAAVRILDRKPAIR